MRLSLRAGPSPAPLAPDPPALSPSRRVPSSSGGSRRASLDQPLHLLELVGAGGAAARTARSRRSSRQRQEPSILCSPSSRFSSVREVTASRATCTSTPRSSRSWAVCETHTCDSMPQTSTWSRPSRSKPSTADAEDRLLERLDPVEVLGHLVGTVSPVPSGYCWVTATGRPRMRALDGAGDALGNRSKCARRAGRPPARPPRRARRDRGRARGRRRSATAPSAKVRSR